MIPDYLSELQAPRIFREALEEYGTVELPGYESNQLILDWAHELGVDQVYTSDSVPWCGLFMALCAKRAGFKPPKNFLWALSWSAWGTPSEPMLGDVLVFLRSGGGHVGLYAGEDDRFYHVLGGNQSDKVCVSAFPKQRLYASRRCPWRFFQPKSVRKIYVNNAVPISIKET